MPLDPSSPFRRRIAVIGGGISGMGAAHFLADAAEVTLFEAGPRLGGHARTVMAGQGGQQPVDTGFIVFNHANYPRLSALFQQLGVPVAPSNMSFAASLRGGEMEYGLENLKAVFSQRRNMFNPKFLGMIRDILRFNARALDAASDRHQPLGDFLEQMQLGDWFRDYYLLPLSGAIWSTPPEQIMRFPAQALIQFFENHALLHHSGQHQWYTVQGGSVEYVRRLEASLRRRLVDLRIGIAQDVWHAPWRHKLSYLLREPGWSHDGSRETSDMIRARWQEQQQRADATPADTTQDEPQKPIAGPRRAA